MYLKVSVNNLSIPTELKAFLKSDQSLEYDDSQCEAGQVTFRSIEQLSISEIYIDSAGSPLATSDPYSGQVGYYIVPIVDLIYRCDGYDPEGILLWLPQENLYGTWDNDHWDLYIFPQADWRHIVNSPLKYLNAQWFPNQVCCEYFVPWPKYPFRKGRPW